MKTKIKILMGAAALLLAAACSKDDSPNNQAKLSQYARDYLAISLYIEKKESPEQNEPDVLKTVHFQNPSKMLLKDADSVFVDTLYPINDCNGYFKMYIDSYQTIMRLELGDLACLLENTQDEYFNTGYWQIQTRYQEDDFSVRMHSHFETYRKENGLKIMDEKSILSGIQTVNNLHMASFSYTLVGQDTTLMQNAEWSKQDLYSALWPDSNTQYPYICHKQELVEYRGVTRYRDIEYTTILSTPCYYTLWFSQYDVNHDVCISGTKKVIYKHGETTGEFIIDFGEGELDTRVTITENGVSLEVDLADIQLFNPQG